MAGSILFCFAIGYYLDRWLHTKGLFISIFILLGVAGAAFLAGCVWMAAGWEVAAVTGLICAVVIGIVVLAS